VTFFIDVNLGTQIKDYLVEMGLTVVLHAEHFAGRANDVDWIPFIAQKGWPVLTRDRQIRRRPLERQAVIDGALKFFVIGCANAGLPTYVQVVRSHLNSIKSLALWMPEPFISTMTLQDLKFEWLGDPVKFATSMH
jgi:hypothetical protein